MKTTSTLRGDKAPLTGHMRHNVVSHLALFPREAE